VKDLTLEEAAYCEFAEVATQYYRSLIRQNTLRRRSLVINAMLKTARSRAEKQPREESAGCG